MKRWFFQVPVMLALAACGDGKPVESPPPAPPLTPVASASASAIAPITSAAPTTPTTPTTAAPVATASPPEKCVAGTYDIKLGCLAAAKAAAPDGRAEAELTALAGDMKKHFTDASKKKCPAKTSEALFGAHAKWNELAASAVEYDRKLTNLGLKLNSPHALASANIDSGLMFARLALSLHACTEDNVDLFTPQQEKIIAAASNSGRDDLKEQMNQLQTAVKEAFRARKDKEVEAVEILALKHVAIGVSVANAFGFSDDAIDEAWSTWRELAIMAGPRVQTYFETTRDPMDPDGSRAVARFSESLSPQWTTRGRGE